MTPLGKGRTKQQPLMKAAVAPKEFLGFLLIPYTIQDKMRFIIFIYKELFLYCKLFFDSKYSTFNKGTNTPVTCFGFARKVAFF